MYKISFNQETTSESVFRILVVAMVEEISRLSDFAFPVCRGMTFLLTGRNNLARLNLHKDLPAAALTTNKKKYHSIVNRQAKHQSRGTSNFDLRCFVENLAEADI